MTQATHYNHAFVQSARRRLLASHPHLEPKLDTIDRFMEAGQRLILCHTVFESQDGPVCSCKKRGQCTSPGKHPLFSGWQRTYATTPEVIYRWLVLKPWANVAVVTGYDHRAKRSLIALDTDKPDWVDGLVVNGRPLGGFLAETYSHRTPRGRHYLFTIEGHQSSIIGLVPGLDLKGQNGYVLLPGSRNQRGDYLSDERSDLANIRGIDPVLLRWVASLTGSVSGGGVSRFSNEEGIEIVLGATTPSTSSRTKSAPTDTLADLEFIEKGSRSNALVQKAGQLYARGYQDPEISKALLKIRDTRCEDPSSFTDAEVENIVRYISNKEAKKRQQAGGKTRPTKRFAFYTKRVEQDARDREVWFASQLVKTTRHGTPLSAVCEVYQALCVREGLRFTQNIDPNAVAKILKEHGYTSKLVHYRRPDNSRSTQRLWDLDLAPVRDALARTEKVSPRSVAKAPPSPVPVTEEPASPAPPSPPAQAPEAPSQAPGRALPLPRRGAIPKAPNDPEALEQWLREQLAF